MLEQRFFIHRLKKMTALELLYDIVSKVEAERLKYRNDTITLEVMHQNVLTISDSIDTSISELSIEEQASTVLKDVNQIKTFIESNIS